MVPAPRMVLVLLHSAANAGGGERCKQQGEWQELVHADFLVIEVDNRVATMDTKGNPPAQ